MSLFTDNVSCTTLNIRGLDYTCGCNHKNPAIVSNFYPCTAAELLQAKKKREFDKIHSKILALLERYNRINSYKVTSDFDRDGILLSIELYLWDLQSLDPVRLRNEVVISSAI